MYVRLVSAPATTPTIKCCKNYEAEYKGASNERDSLSLMLAAQEEAMNTFLEDFNDVERNLDSVAQRQNIITQSVIGRVELNSSAKERINENIKAINSLMDDNRKKISALNNKLKSSGKKIAQFEKMMVALNSKLASKDSELAGLNTKLDAMNLEVQRLSLSLDTMITVNTDQQATIDQQTMDLHTAYYVIGEKKELEEKNVIDRKGGLLGIGRTAVIEKDFDNSKFTKIDNTQVLLIPINKKNAKVITSHPTDAYSLDKDDNGHVTNLRITLADKFWSQSKYLVVVTN